MFANQIKLSHNMNMCQINFETVKSKNYHMRFQKYNANMLQKIY